MFKEIHRLKLMVSLQKIFFKPLIILKASLKIGKPSLKAPTNLFAVILNLQASTKQVACKFFRFHIKGLRQSCIMKKILIVKK